MSWKLSRAERRVFELIIEGYTCKEIGKMLGISHRTIEDHRRSIYEKVKARNVAQAVAIVLRKELTQ